MARNLIFFPLLAQIALTVAVYFWLGVVKARATQRGEVDALRRALHRDAWPDHVIQVSNNIDNQFETPVLYYALLLVLWAIPAVDIYALLLAWGYVATRIVHVYVHLGSNYVPLRRRVFSIGVVCLIGLLVLCVRGVVSGL